MYSKENIYLKFQKFCVGWVEHPILDYIDEGYGKDRVRYFHGAQEKDKRQIATGYSI